MGLHLHLGPSMIGLFLFIINIIFVHVPTPVSANYEEHKNCSAPFRCANRDGIGYPFWGGNRPEYCGYPGFELSCEEDVPEINILNITYKVLNIDKATPIITVAREDYWDNYCPSNLVDTALNFSLFDYAPATANLTLYYSCPPNFTNGTFVPSLLDPYEFRCYSDESNAADNYFFSWDVNSIFNKTFNEAVKAYFGSCAKSVLLPLQQPTVESLVKNPSPENLTTALREGFGLQWLADDSLCDTCEQSKGECGYSARTGQFNCYCPDKAGMENNVSDFGLAKQSQKKESTISMLHARGTIGYIAPEVFCRSFGGVSHESDVYSYGMMILEMAVGRKNAEVTASRSSDIYFPNSIYKHIEPGNDFQLDGVVTEEEKELVKKMILVSLWCIQTNPSDRPSMHKVLGQMKQ